MSLGFDREIDVISAGDSAPLYVTLRDRNDQLVLADDLADVTFTVQKPDGTKSTDEGEILDDGQGYLLYNATDDPGQYVTVATFTRLGGERLSVRSDFEVIDPFNPPVPTATEIICSMAWERFEDCFDAEDEGPWLRDQTLNTFNIRKLEKFLDDALFDINMQNPPTTLALGNFVINDVPTIDAPLLAQAIFIQALHHLIRSYTEQPLPQGAQVVYEDRRDYLTRWQSVLQVEYQKYTRWLALYKRQYLGLGQTRTIVSTKAGRLLPAPMRTRNVGRGVF